MKLVFIYGPPAVGKLTVARELAKITGFRLHHNHVSIDFVKSIFDFGTPQFSRAVDRFRREILEEAAREGVDTIFTFVYGGGVDDEFVGDVVRRVNSHGGEVCFVRLYCQPAELLRRVGGGQRKRVGKLASKSVLKSMFKRFDLSAGVPGFRSLSIDTTKLSPRQVARKIAVHYDLPTKSQTD